MDDPWWADPGWAGLYVLDDTDTPIPCRDTLAWGTWMGEARKSGRLVIARDYDEGDEQRQILVSTVFLGVDHNFGSGPPVLFETMAFRNGDALDDLSRRYTSKEAALRGHQEVCRILTQAIRESAKELPNQ